MADSRTARIAVPLAIVLLAALLRLWALGTVPPGFQFDEAHNAIDAARVLDGARPLFFPDNGGREPLVTYLQAASLGILGRDEPAMALRLVSALVGVLTVAVLYGFASRFYSDGLMGVLSAAFLAASYWHVHFSRYGIRAVLAPLWATLAVWAWWVAVGEPTDGDREPGSRAGVGAAMACGAFLAAAVYSHPSGRLLPIVLVAHAAYRTVATSGAAARRTWTSVAVAGLVALALFVPLGLYFADHPVQFTGHPSDVSLTAVAERQHDGSLPRALLANGAAVAGMFFVSGDPSTFHNLPGLPVFDPLSALAAVVGFGVLLAALASRNLQRRDRAVLLAAWLVILLLPTLLSDRPPNYSRAIAALPAVVMLPALGLRWTLDQVTGLSAAGRRTVVAVVIGVAALWTAWHYFVVFAATPHVYYSYDVEKLDAYRWLEDQAEAATVFLHPLWARHATIAYLNQNGPVRELDSHDTAVLPDDGRDVVFALPAKEADREGWDAALGDLLAGAGERHVIMDAQGNPALIAYEVPGSPPLADGLRPQHMANVLFGDGILLVGYTLGAAQPGEPLPVVLTWVAQRPMSDDLTVFVHLVDATGEAVGQLDREPAWASYRTSEWQPGDVVIDRFEPVLAEGAAGPISVEVGWYDAATGSRLPTAAGDSVTIGPVALTGAEDGP